jgi:sec-independent protein translocase protein TatA
MGSGPYIGHPVLHLDWTIRPFGPKWTIRPAATLGWPVRVAVFQSIGPLELLIVLGIVLIIFGPKRLPSLGRQLGAGMREFKDSISRKGGDDEDDDAVADSRRDAAAALGRPEGETATSVSDGVTSDKR